MAGYMYNGPVVVNNKCVQHIWNATTYANSEKRAKSNLAYRFKKDTGQPVYAKVSLPGKLELI